LITAWLYKYNNAPWYYCSTGVLWCSRVQCYARHIIGHVGDNLPSQSLDWCKNPVKPNQTITMLQHKT